ncbi:MULTISPECIES: hypothetical protein [unclassified Halorhodospira]|uniref:hypothetical protein n=1 Tax=unclassified Halorhodospira TaxID=2626748 RepID=UPI001EE9471C|nr:MULTISPECIES: hypothetical protein [unclassified Halorhodospira]MCG5539864.1 hypothetical protein [Halorhodospira sp. M39old]MCG5544685.1 hypothetical protein [Halorhodospira sp. M38]
MKKFGHFLIGMASGVVLLILTSFVPPQFNKVMDLVEGGAEIDATGFAVFGVLAFLGSLMYLSGHIFHAFNKKVTKYFESWFE